VKLWT